MKSLINAFPFQIGYPKTAGWLSFSMDTSYKLRQRGEGQNASFDKKTLKRIQELDFLDENKRNTLFDLIDTYIRDAKTSQAYAG